MDLLLFISEPVRNEIHYEVHTPVLTKHSFVPFVQRCESLRSAYHICRNAISQVSLSRDDDNTLFDCGFMYKRQSRRFRTFSTFFYVKMDSGS